MLVEILRDLRVAQSLHLLQTSNLVKDDRGETLRTAARPVAAALSLGGSLGRCFSRGLAIELRRGRARSKVGTPVDKLITAPGTA
jgi:hypothetical protein